MKVLVILLVLVVLVLSFLQSITRYEIARIRREEVAVEAQLDTLRKRISEAQLALEAGCLDIKNLKKHLDGQIATNADVFDRVNQRIDDLAASAAYKVKKTEKKTEGPKAQQ